MTGIVLVTHDGLGEAIRHQAENILGRPIRLTTVAVSYRADPDSCLDELRAALAMSSDSSGALVLTDLPGATPDNLARRAAAEKQVLVVSGLNLPMLLKVINHADKPAEALAELARQGGQQGIIQT